ncbi:PREDICTED: CDGSH iron-sulfur domain-containing protein 1 [Dipodomys ordii]|uniref:CDGSH iron-sulfur domain-containing protein 2 n=2 Tax=Dipodomys TaxID=10016 RepID=A0A1S3F7M3_DIPOR|nr:PREDICTED: CDGSH iron-sulfur domain-containing protein 1 [Dipodomys ordii]
MLCKQPPGPPHTRVCSPPRRLRGGPPESAPADAAGTLTPAVLTSPLVRGVLRERLASPGAMGLISDSGLRVEWIAAVTVAAGTAALGYLAYKRFYVKDHRSKAMVNLHIQKDNPKIVHAFDMEDLGDKAVYCRCWRSKKFPFCDGAHTKHNEETGDNVGPLIIKKKET